MVVQAWLIGNYHIQGIPMYNICYACRSMNCSSCFCHLVFSKPQTQNILCMGGLLIQNSFHHQVTGHEQDKSMEQSTRIVEEEFKLKELADFMTNRFTNYVMPC